MMFTWGDVDQPLAETALAVEEIVRQQTIEMVSYMRNLPRLPLPHSHLTPLLTISSPFESRSRVVPIWLAAALD